MRCSLFYCCCAVLQRKVRAQVWLSLGKLHTPSSHFERRHRAKTGNNPTLMATRIMNLRRFLSLEQWARTRKTETTRESCIVKSGEAGEIKFISLSQQKQTANRIWGRASTEDNSTELRESVPASKRLERNVFVFISAAFRSSSHFIAKISMFPVFLFCVLRGVAGKGTRKITPDAAFETKMEEGRWERRECWTNCWK